MSFIVSLDKSLLVSMATLIQHIRIVELCSTNDLELVSSFSLLKLLLGSFLVTKKRIDLIFLILLELGEFFQLGSNKHLLEDLFILLMQSAWEISVLLNHILLVSIPHCLSN